MAVLPLALALASVAASVLSVASSSPTVPRLAAIARQDDGNTTNSPNCVDVSMTCNEDESFRCDFQGSTVCCAELRCIEKAAPECLSDSVKALLKAECSGSACFPAGAVVRRRDARGRVEDVRVEDVEVGDEVVVGAAGATSQVHFFSHRARWVRRGDFVEVDYEVGGEGGWVGSLVATEGHYVHAAGGLVAAGDIEAGDRLRVVGEGGKEAVARVRKVERRVTRMGLYNPHTLSGDVVVDGVLTSCYTTAVPPALAHVALAPVRALWMVAGPCKVTVHLERVVERVASSGRLVRY